MSGHFIFLSLHDFSQAMDPMPDYGTNRGFLDPHDPGHFLGCLLLSEAEHDGLVFPTRELRQSAVEVPLEVLPFEVGKGILSRPATLFTPPSLGHPLVGLPTGSSCPEITDTHVRCEPMDPGVKGPVATVRRSFFDDVHPDLVIEILDLIKIPAVPLGNGEDQPPPGLHKLSEVFAVTPPKPLQINHF